MAPLLAIAAAAVVWASAQTPPVAAPAKQTAKQKAAAAFLSRGDVSASVSPEELAADPALAQALPLAARVQKGGASQDEVRRASELLSADPALALCLYAGGPCPQGGPQGRRPQDGRAQDPAQEQQAAQEAGRSTLPDQKRMARLAKSAAGLFDQRQVEAMPEGEGVAGSASARAGRMPATVSAGFAPSVQLPASFKRDAAAPPPLSRPELSNKDQFINDALPMGAAYSRAGTLNRESKEGSKQKICGFLAKANWDPSRAWELSKQARDAKGADPGDLDTRNAEHYLYAYSTTDKPASWTDSAPVQALLAVGWTPFKAVTQRFRPTTTPTTDEMGWGVKGAVDGGWSKPDWKKECGGSAAPQPAAVGAKL